MNISTKFISFEGIDFSGKTTQIKCLVKNIESAGEKVLVVREPGGTVISEKIRKILLDRENDSMSDVCEVLLYSAARNQLVIEKIKKELLSGNFVIADRFVDSTTAYQGFGRGLPMSFITELNKVATAEILPSLTFYLDLPTDEIIKRRLKRNKKDDRLEKAGVEFYTKVRNGYLKIAKENKNRIKIIDAKNTIEKIERQIWEFVSTKLNLK